jgi:hypothetical protein
VKLQTRYQSINNVDRFMLKDNLSNLRLHEGGFVTIFRHIQKTQFEHQGINQHVLKVYVVEQMFNILPLKHEVGYNAFSGQDVPPTF